MTLSIRLNENDYENFVSAQVVEGIEQVARTFSFAATAPDSDFIPIREGDKVEILADGQRILKGYVDQYSISYDSSSHSIMVKGRSATADLVDCTVKGAKEFNNMDLYQICKAVAGEYSIPVDNFAGVIAPFTDIASAQVGQKCFDYLEGLAQKRQVILTDDDHGDLVITTASKKMAPVSLLNQINNPSNNILSASRDVNISKLYSEYIAQSQGNPLTSDLIPGDIVSKKSIAYDREARSGRTIEFKTKKATSDETLGSRAKWEAIARRARAFNYTAKMAGHTVEDFLWKSNLRYRIDDDMCQIHGIYLCNRVEFNYDTGNGSTTTLNFVDKNSYTLENIESSNIIL